MRLRALRRAAADMGVYPCVFPGRMIVSMMPPELVDIVLHAQRLRYF
jgi:hypothetical protein